MFLKKDVSTILTNVNGKKLDKYQLRAVLCKRSNILVLAGAGSGKTLMIVAKVKYLINNLNVNPKEILCLSFTNDAVNKLKNDIDENNVDVMTFHRFALSIIGMKKEVLTENMLMHIVMNTFSNQQLLALYEMNKSQIYKLIETFINLFKSKNYDLDKFYEFIKKANFKDKLLLKEIMKCYICYESYLRNEELLDFNDMINMAINKIQDFGTRYKYVIIDEYQDTSVTKFTLINKLIRLSNAKLFAVGDDFQSIYRFAGSDISIITKFKWYFPFAKIYKLKNTYRNPDELIKIAGRFIMKNPVQIRKKLRSNIHFEKAVEIIYYECLNDVVNEIISKDKINNLFILSRNNKDLEQVVINHDIDHQKMTAHKSKGLERDYVFIINLSDLANGFPNKYNDHEILKYVNNYKEYYPYEEERRLFYVALTRCKKKVYLFAPKDNPSIFVKELSKGYKNVSFREK